MKINYNMSAVFANDYLRKSDNALSISVEKLSSGYKVNHAKDNPAGIAKSKKIHAQLKALSVSSRSASDGISIIETADGALSEVHDMLQRMNELSIKAANGTMSENDRKIVQDEVNALKEEITRIAKTTEFNGSTLLDGTYDLKGYVSGYQDNCGAGGDDSSIVRVETYSPEAEAGQYHVDVTAKENQTTGELEISKIVISRADGSAFKTVDSPKETNGKVAITAKDDFSLTLQFDMDKMKEKLDANPDPTVVDYEAGFTLDLTGYGSLTMQVGVNEGDIVDVSIPSVTSEALGVGDLDVTTRDLALESIDKIATAIDQVSSVRSRLGSYQNRLEDKISTSDLTYESMTGAYSRIMDVDMAEEMTEYTQQQVLSQAGTSILAQANERPSLILQLLQ